MSDDDLPLIYVASPLTRANQSPKQRQSVTFQVDRIVATIQDPRFDGGTLQFRTHAPAVLSAPWSSDASQWDIYRQNIRLVLAEADAMIILSLHGGSSGTGQELELACRRGIPILHLSPEGESVSRQVSGNPLIKAETYELPDELASTVRRFIQKNRRKIEGGPRNRLNLSILYGALQSDLWDKWTSLTQSDQAVTAEQCAMTPDYVDHYLSAPLLVATWSISQIIRFGTSLNVDVAHYFTEKRSRLSYRHVKSLVSAQEENGWSDRQTERLRQHAEEALATDGVRRLILSSPADWQRLFEGMER
ncbi:MAG: nucleoside 2-deoxyribosyltransferase [Acidimicrobiia bacterium]|nr:nucleoside 2-deoxyribosyltransferase [Acidimicrobiia bacterium]